MSLYPSDAYTPWTTCFPDDANDWSIGAQWEFARDRSRSITSPPALLSCQVFLGSLSQDVLDQAAADMGFGPGGAASPSPLSCFPPGADSWTPAQRYNYASYFRWEQPACALWLTTYNAANFYTNAQEGFTGVAAERTRIDDNLTASVQNAIKVETDADELAHLQHLLDVQLANREYVGDTSWSDAGIGVGQSARSIYDKLPDLPTLPDLKTGLFALAALAAVWYGSRVYSNVK